MRAVEQEETYDVPLGVLDPPPPDDVLVRDGRLGRAGCVERAGRRLGPLLRLGRRGFLDLLGLPHDLVEGLGLEGEEVGKAGVPDLAGDGNAKVGELDLGDGLLLLDDLHVLVLAVLVVLEPLAVSQLFFREAGTLSAFAGARGGRCELARGLHSLVRECVLVIIIVAKESSSVVVVRERFGQGAADGRL